MKRYVLYSEDYGIYLGSMLGMGFWTNLDPVGQDEAITFENEKVANEFMQTWNSQAPNVQIISINVNDNSIYATIEQCVSAGLPSWNPEG